MTDETGFEVEDVVPDKYVLSCGPYYLQRTEIPGVFREVYRKLEQATRMSKVEAEQAVEDLRTVWVGLMMEPAGRQADHRYWRRRSRIGADLRIAGASDDEQFQRRAWADVEEVDLSAADMAAGEEVGIVYWVRIDWMPEPGSRSLTWAVVVEDGVSSTVRERATQFGTVAAAVQEQRRWVAVPGVTGATVVRLKLNVETAPGELGAVRP